MLNHNTKLQNQRHNPFLSTTRQSKRAISLIIAITAYCTYASLPSANARLAPSEEVARPLDACDRWLVLVGFDSSGHILNTADDRVLPALL